MAILKHKIKKDKKSNIENYPLKKLRDCLKPNVWLYYDWLVGVPPAYRHELREIGWYEADCSSVGMHPTGWERPMEAQMRSGSNNKKLDNT